MRVAIVYDRLNKLGGAERVLTAFAQIFPASDWFTSTYVKSATPFSQSWNVKSSFLSNIPYFRSHHEYLPFLMPFIFEAFDFSEYDLVITIGSAESKGVITKPSTLHIHYCLTPTRYLYSHAAEYLNHKLYQFLAIPLRAWDLVAARRPDVMIAISTQVKNRIKRYYHRDSIVLHPPVDTARFVGHAARLSSLPRRYFLVVSRLVSYKKLDFLLQVFAKTPRQHLVIVGTGNLSRHLVKIAPPNVHLLGFMPDSSLPSLYQHSLAYLQANEEDFGISMVEAQASGTPVIAYHKGGASDIVVPAKTGILLPDLDLSTWVSAIDIFDAKRFDREACRQNAQRFSIQKWRTAMYERINKYVSSK